MRSRIHLKAFSMLELTVTLGITAVIMVMLSNVLVTSIGISQKSLARSFAREEISQVADAISSDIRAANEISNCGGSILNGISCRISNSEATFTWTTCPGEESGQIRICKLDQGGNQVFVTSQNINITVFTIEEGFEQSSSTSGSRRNLLLTIAGDDVREGLGINNILRQTSISSRNYLLANAPASAVCGNSVVEVGETCDDGNLINGDGCRNDCRIETCEIETETITVTFGGISRGSSDRGKCTSRIGGSGGNTVRGIRVSSETVDIGKQLCGINTLDIQTVNRRFTYDDGFLLTLNGAVLVASNFKIYEAYPEVYPGIRDASRASTILGYNRSGGNQPACIGDVVGSKSNTNAACYVPPSESVTSGFGFSVTPAVAEQLGVFLKGQTRFVFGRINTGNLNSETDCTMRGFTMTVEAQTIPDGCNCLDV